MATRPRRQNPFHAATYGNVAYDVNTRGNVAYQPERQTQRQRVSEDHLRRARQPRTRVELRPQQSISVTAVLGFVLAAVLAVGVLASYVQLNSVYANTVSAQSALTELESTYAKLEAEDQQIFDNETLQKAAEEAGLVEPGVGQQVYLELSEPDSTVVYQQKAKTSGLQGCWNAVKSFFGNIGEYFS